MYLLLMESTQLPSGAPGQMVLKTGIVVIGAGQAGLSAAYHLSQKGLTPVRDFIILDDAPAPGGAWQFRWPSLTLSTVNRVHDLPGMSFAETLDEGEEQVEARLAVPRYYQAYERQFNLPVYRPIKVESVTHRGERFLIEADRMRLSARGIINATGTWSKPYIPSYPGAELFKGRQLHTKDYYSAEEFRGLRVAIVGGGISALQLMNEISFLAETRWFTRRPPVFNKGPFNEELGSRAVAKVEERVRAGLEPESVVSVTGLIETPYVESMRKRGILQPHPMFTEIREEGVVMQDASVWQADVILWCTGFRSALNHMEGLKLRSPLGGIQMGGRLATQVVKDPRIHLIGYGPSASTIGANRAGRAAADELTTYLGIHPA